MSSPPHRFATSADVAAFAAVPLAERLDGRDIIAMITAHADRDGGADAIHYVPSGRAGDIAVAATRRQLHDGARAIAAQLRQAGIRSGDVVATLLPNGPATIAATIAAIATGTLAPINLYLEPAQVLTLIDECRARVVLVPAHPPAVLAKMLATLRERCIARALTLIEIDTAHLPSPAADAPPLQPRAPQDRVALFHTGGTTGLPKFVPLTAHNIAAAALISGFGYGYGDQDRVLCAMPMFHVGGLFACSLFPLSAGSRLVILGPLGYRGDGVIAGLPATVVDYGVSVIVGPPTVMAQFAADLPDRARLPNLRLLVNGAAALPRAVGERLSNGLGVPVVEPWGLTEATLAVTSGPSHGANRQGSVGLPLPYCEVKAVRTDADGRAIGNAGEDIGVLAIRSPMVFAGYLNRDAKDQPFFADGWLDTGDLGRVDRDGFVWVTGRAKELIKRGGHGIDPGAIEDVLAAHDSVTLAAAVGRPDAYAGEIPVAYVQLRPGAAVDEAELLAFAGERIRERAAIPKEIIVLPQLPVTAVGKVHKQPLKLHITQRVVEDVVRAVTGPDQPATVTIAPHPRHGLLVQVRAAPAHLQPITNALGAFTFAFEVTPANEVS
ncbi:AMP-binding protein [Bradyrhizobium sp. NP1]|uniref:AMP-binding protein n=1 Tax=Bradyrhizobium sp. NP1 TaxID=3049772 RepID=UPI0025A50391|nr:AMP-binding protein [Bradyrhizobium sp. NP1]WJR80958.1 AMP-binding protein [Bradyrhizobium sp. NP1]